MRVVFFGTSHFASSLFLHLAHLKNIDIAAVVTRPDRARGRSLSLFFSPVKETLLQNFPSIPLFQPVKASTEEFAAIMRSYVPDLFVVVAYGEIIKQMILSIPKYGCINIHASLLPRYRGAAPIQRCLMAGEKETGITIIEMALSLDAGPMLKKVPVHITENMNFGELEQQLLKAACEALDKTLEALESGRVQKELQDETEATFAAKLTPKDEEIQWSEPAAEVHNRIRALSPLPGAFCLLNIGGQKKRLKITRSRLRNDLEGRPGDILLLTKNSLVVACGEGGLELVEVQLEGKKSLVIADFLRGLANTTFSFIHFNENPAL